ncbi:MAG: DM13 domain-containing protein [Chloroflexi bacterium]|nr:MAG: DM13 domain-containing protein [Chloroflexota bacterium]TMC56770.1 MAG: DM13 domain-containing protein [Chloroflexota bacterium]
MARYPSAPVTMSAISADQSAAIPIAATVTATSGPRTRARHHAYIQRSDAAASIHVAHPARHSKRCDATYCSRAATLVTTGVPGARTKASTTTAMRLRTAHASGATARDSSAGRHTPVTGSRDTPDMPRSRAVRGAAIVAAILLVIVGWYLGSPLFIRTTANEALPITLATAPSSTATSAASISSPAATPRTAITTVLRRGELHYVDTLHNGKGDVLLIAVDAKQFLRFEDVAITNAPDVHVYLSKDSGGKWSDASSTYVGALKATNGSFNYELSSPFDLAGYSSVIVWCRAFSVLVTWADLEKP